MNILLAFKAEPDAGMLAEKEWQAAQGNSGPDVSLLRSLLGADEQAAAALLLAQRKNGTSMSLTALSMGDERALHWLRYLMALGFEDAVLLETAADLRFAPEFVARHIAEWQYQNPLELIITGCQSSEGQNGQTPFLLAEMLGWPCFTQVERFTLERKSYGSTIYAKGCSHEYRTCDNKSGPCRNSELAGGAGFQRLYPGTLANRTTADDCGTGAGCAGGTVATNACGGCPLSSGRVWR